MRKVLWGPSILWSAAVGFVLRVGVRLHAGGASFFDNGYAFFFDLAHNIAAGKGYAFTGGRATAFRVPLYPIFLAAVTTGRRWFLPVVFAQAAIGIGTVLCAAVLAEELWGGSASVIAAFMAALYPYYVVHDTALQETSLFTLLTSISIILFLRARRRTSATAAILAGAALGATLLTRATIAPFIALALFLLLWVGQGTLVSRMRQSLLCGIACMLVLAPWLLRSYRLTGGFTLGTESGMELWNGNNSLTFSHYPLESIDRSKTVAFEALTPGERAELDQLSGDEVARARWFRRKGLAYMRAHPAETLMNGFRKVEAAFGWLPSPRHDRFHNCVYALSYGPVMLLGLWGMWIQKENWRENVTIYALFVSFAAVTAVFIGHTSYRSYLDVY